MWGGRGGTFDIEHSAFNIQHSASVVMPSWFLLDPEPRADLAREDADLVIPAALAERFIGEYSRPGEVVFDPFAGFGTVLAAAQRMGRRGVGIELHPQRFEHARSVLAPPAAILHGNALEIAIDEVPPIDLMITSPPYWDPEVDAFAAYDGPDPGYERHLALWERLLARWTPRLREGGRVVVFVQNVLLPERAQPLHPLAWDIGRLLARHLRFEREWIACARWTTSESERYGDHTYCLAARKDV